MLGDRFLVGEEILRLACVDYGIAKPPNNNLWLYKTLAEPSVKLQEKLRKLTDSEKLEWGRRVPGLWDGVLKQDKVADVRIDDLNGL